MLKILTYTRKLKPSHPRSWTHWGSRGTSCTTGRRAADGLATYLSFSPIPDITVKILAMPPTWRYVGSWKPYELLRSPWMHQSRSERASQAQTARLSSNGDLLETQMPVYRYNGIHRRCRSERAECLDQLRTISPRGCTADCHHLTMPPRRMLHQWILALYDPGGRALVFEEMPAIFVNRGFQVVESWIHFSCYRDPFSILGISWWNFWM